MSKPKYYCRPIIGGYSITTTEDDQVAAIVKQKRSAEWLTSELNTLNWAVEHLLKVRELEDESES